MKKQEQSYWVLPGSMAFGMLTGSSLLYTPLQTACHTLAQMSSTIFINLLQLVSLPIIFLAMITTISGLKNFEELQIIGSRVLRYTLITTIAAATTALLLFIWIDPASAAVHLQAPHVDLPSDTTSYLTYFANMIP